MSAAKLDNFMQLFWTFVSVPDVFFACARNMDEYFTKLIPSKLLNFFHYFIFYRIAGQKFKMKGIFMQI